MCHEIEAALLHPAVEIFLRDFVGIMEDLIIGREDRHRGFFD